MINFSKCFATAVKANGCLQLLKKGQKRITLIEQLCLVPVRRRLSARESPWPSLRPCVEASLCPTSFRKQHVFEFSSVFKKRETVSKSEIFHFSVLHSATILKIVKKQRRTADPSWLRKVAPLLRKEKKRR